MIRCMSNCVQQNRQSKHKTMKRKLFSKSAASLRLVISPRMSNIWIPPSNTSRRLTNLVKKPLIWHLFFSGRIKVASNPATHICVFRLLIPEEPVRLPGRGDDARPRSSGWHKPLKKPSGRGRAGPAGRFCRPTFALGFRILGESATADSQGFSDLCALFYFKKC